jgi:hypothetical protein
VEPLRAQHRIMLKRAIDRGQLPANTDTEVALDLLYGAAYHRQPECLSMITEDSRAHMTGGRP